MEEKITNAEFDIILAGLTIAGAHDISLTKNCSSVEFQLRQDKRKNTVKYVLYKHAYAGGFRVRRWIRNPWSTQPYQMFRDSRTGNWEPMNIADACDKIAVYASNIKNVKENRKGWNFIF